MTTDPMTHVVPEWQEDPFWTQPIAMIPHTKKSAQVADRPPLLHAKVTFDSEEEKKQLFLEPPTGLDPSALESGAKKTKKKRTVNQQQRNGRSF